jgi:thioredoxin-dependent peroxiredoxin
LRTHAPIISRHEEEVLAMLKVGDTAPDFTATTHEGKELKLSSLRGHKVLLWFYPKANTSG